MRKSKLFIAVLIALVLCACNRYNPTPRQDLPKTYTTAYLESYGRCYDSIDNYVFALDLYTDGIYLDENHRIKGSGYNLYLSDIFTGGTRFIPGVYHSDTTAERYTFLPGMDFDGTPHGMYVLTIENNEIAHIQVLDSGSFIYRNDSLIFSLFYHTAEGYKRNYDCLFYGDLLPWQGN